jgi:DNA-binding response OmpR family regulator
MPSGQYYIALVEDSAADAFLVREALEQAGVRAELQILQDGEVAIDFLEAIESNENAPRPNLVILDLNLPLVTGEQVLERVRRTRRCGSTPVIILTSSESPRDRDAVSRLGATEYFRKSSNLDEFMALGYVVRNLLDGKSSGASA